MKEIIRPTLVVDKEVCLRNIEKMVRKAKKYGLHFRPHFKTHQSATIGDWFRKYGVKAITVSSVRMAEYFAANGWKDITIAFPLNIREIENISRLAEKIRLNVLVENREAATVLAEKTVSPAGVWLKIDTGANRTGIEPSDIRNIRAIIDILLKNKMLTFKGFLTHNGQSYTAQSTNEIFSFHFDALLQLKKLKQKFQSQFPKIEVSIGDTPTAAICTNFTDVDEIRPGNFVFFDLMQQSLGVCDFDDIAVRVVCPVVAKHQSRNEIVIHGGAIHLSQASLPGIGGKNSFGHIIATKNDTKKLLSPRNYVSKISQEHGILKVTPTNFRYIYVGDLIEIVPVHSCLTANLFRKYLTTSGEEITTINS